LAASRWLDPQNSAAATTTSSPSDRLKVIHRVRLRSWKMTSSTIPISANTAMVDAFSSVGSHPASSAPSARIPASRSQRKLLPPIPTSPPAISPTLPEASVTAKARFSVSTWPVRPTMRFIM